MININELKGRIVAKGYTQEEVARMLEITPKTMYTRMQRGVFNSDEIYKLIKILEIKDPMNIFFVEEVTQHETQ